MRILPHTKSGNAPAWHAALTAALPEADIAVWPAPWPAGNVTTDYHIRWKRLGDPFVRMSAPKVILNLSAGVEQRLPITRIVDRSRGY
jgi:hypothetical protein